ncbi:uncharacterized protein LOC131667655 isoform X2 [Phymastichus coffea]|uniref:uncharacterized protein LOC131667655 isoform X2 n=1 Tax=Phymastichus coffea TaxID=108790 RepID=UPI00273A77E2|nr:uncharacterized protein LOC131667655 isoform X2 [Phymastichus coffea]
MTMIYKLLVTVAVICECALAHHLRHHGDAKSLQEKEHLPYGYKKLDKMMNKAILQIILGELHPSDVLLLKALNYTLEEVMAIREHELSKLKAEKALGGSKYQVHHRSFQRDASLDTYNKQAVYDYENAQTEEDNKPTTEDSARQTFDRAMEPHVVFKIRYDDADFDPASDQTAKTIFKNHRTKTIFVPDRGVNSAARQSFQVDGDLSPGAALNVAATLEATSSGSVNLEDFNKQAIADYENLVPNGEQEDKHEFANQENFLRSINDSSSTTRPIGEYEGLEWIGDDVYRVVPEAIEAMLNYEDPEQISSADALNDTLEYQNDAEAGDAAAAGNFTENMNLTSYQRLALAQRRDQGQKAIEDIKMRVLAMTGRFNLSSPNNQVQREKLTMFSPSCQTPRNTDAEAWSDSYLMNMHFQLNLTSGEHVLAAKLRLYKLPQESLASSSSTSTSSSIYEEDEEDEKKIRVSVYFYTKSLKKHRVKKRLMDSIVTPLTAQGSHLALDVRQALRFWRPNAQQHNNSNHGLVVQVEDQDGRALKPSLYIQEPNCQTGPRQNPDEKAYQFVPALFVRACIRYVRFVNGKMEMYVQCRQRH